MAAHHKQNWFHTFLFGKDSTAQANIDHQFFFLNVFSLLGMLVLFGFGTLHVLRLEYVAGLPEIFGGIIFLLNVGILQFGQHIREAKTLLLVQLGSQLILLLFSGGIDRTGIYWFASFPLAAFFLLGKSRGAVLTGIFILTTVSFSYADYFGLTSLVYSIVEVRQLLVSLFVISTFIYMYQFSIEAIERRTKSSEVFLQSIIDHIPDIIFVKDPIDFTYLRFNKAGEQLMAKAQANLIGKNAYDFFPSDQANVFAQQDRNVIVNKQVVDVPNDIVKTPTGTKVLHTIKIPVYNEDGKPEYLLGISEDITEKKKVSDALGQKSEEIEEINSMMVGRELKMAELKKENDALRAELEKRQ